jgi:hypothetical protein
MAAQFRDFRGNAWITNTFGEGLDLLAKARLERDPSEVHYLPGPVDAEPSLSCSCQARTPSVTRS